MNPEHTQPGVKVTHLDSQTHPSGNGNAQATPWTEGPKRMSPDMDLVREYEASGKTREEAIKAALIEMGRREIYGHLDTPGTGGIVASRHLPVYEPQTREGGAQCILSTSPERGGKNGDRETQSTTQPVFVAHRPGCRSGESVSPNESLSPLAVCAPDSFCLWVKQTHQTHQTHPAPSLRGACRRARRARSRGEQRTGQPAGRARRPAEPSIHRARRCARPPAGGAGGRVRAPRGVGWPDSALDAAGLVQAVFLTLASVSLRPDALPRVQPGALNRLITTLGPAMDKMRLGE